VTSAPPHGECQWDRSIERSAISRIRQVKFSDCKREAEKWRLAPPRNCEKGVKVIAVSGGAWPLFSAPLKLADAFELPSDAPRQYTLKSPWKADAGLPPQSLAAEADYRIDLQPFEVRVLEAIPGRPTLAGRD
jgi:hypothetical protein